MKRTLDNLAEKLTERDCERFEPVFSDFMRTAGIADDEKQRILSSVIRKAGFEMNENITITKVKRKKRGKRLFILIAAVLMIILGTIGAGAYFLNKQGVINGMNLRMWNLREATEEELELLNGMTSTKGRLIENTFEEIDVSYDGVVCDGMQMIVILTLKKKDGTPLKAPKGYEWSAAYSEESSLSPFAGKPDRRYFSQALNENDDGSLSLTYRSMIYDLHNLFSDKTKIGINGLYCVPAATTEESREIIDYVNIVSNAYIKDKDLEAAEADYFAKLEKYSVEYYKGSAVCEADSDGVIVKPKTFTADYKGEEISVIATPLNLELQCFDIQCTGTDSLFSEEEIKNQNWKKIQEERFSTVEIFYTDGSSETARCVGCGAGGSAKRFSFSCDYSTGKPMVISKIDYIVFDSETINFDTE